MTDKLPGARAALVDNAGVTTPPFYRYFQALERLQAGTASAADVAAINAQISAIQAEIAALPKSSFPTLQVSAPLTSAGLLQNGFARLGWKGTTSDVPEGTNLYYTDARAQDAVPPLVFGQEYLYAFHQKLISNSAASMLFSGDSTTFGTSITNDDYLLHTSVLRNGLNLGHNLTATNAGHSGADTQDWITSYLADDLAANPDLMVLRWGLNDPFYGRNISQFETSLRSGLSTIRASKSISQMSVVLMVPNTASDSPNGRDAAWMELTRPVIRQAAIDYQCTFIDTFKLWDDTVNASGNWMDNIFGDGRALHPLEAMNGWIASKISEVIFPDAISPKRTSLLVTKTVNQTITNNAWSVIQYNNVVNDARGEWSATGYSFTPKSSGVYLIAVYCLVTTPVDQQSMNVAVFDGSTEVVRVGAVYPSVSSTPGFALCYGTVPYPLNAGTAYTFKFLQQGSGTNTIYGAAGAPITYLSILRT